MELVILLAAVLNLSGVDMRIGDYPEDTDAAGWKEWMVEHCPTSNHGEYLFKGFEKNMDFNLEFRSMADMDEACGLNNVLACYVGKTDTIYLPDDGGAFLAACHELAHARGNYSH